VLCLGNFDGVHIGHAALVDETLKMKKELSASIPNVRAVALCFSVLPVNYFGNDKIKNLMTLEDKLDTFKSMGLDGVYVCDFGTVYSYSPDRFIDEILFDECDAIGAVCGFNYSFGAKAAGNADTLNARMSEKGYAFSMVDQVSKFGKTVSSTQIRQYINDGDFPSANTMLGRPFSISHKVVHGKNLGTKLGFPTINHIVEPSDRQIIPSFGIYATKTLVDGVAYNSVTNVGNRPTVSTSGLVTVETHLIDDGDFSDLYGKNVKVQFYVKLRDEMKFSSKEELSAAISRDVENAKGFFLSFGETK
jgi:riboflavin kinase/FMN adenylyltransferase